MPNRAIIVSENPEIPALTAYVDGYPEMSHRLTSLSGGAPLEDGAEVTDHVIAREPAVTLTGHVSSLRSESGPTRGGRATEAWQAILRLQSAGHVVSVYTPWASYSEMVIRRAEADSTGAGLGMRFKLELQGVLRVGLRQDEITRDRVDSGQADRRTSQVDRGRVLPVELPPEPHVFPEAPPTESEVAASPTLSDAAATLRRYGVQPPVIPDPPPPPLHNFPVKPPEIVREETRRREIEYAIRESNRMGVPYPPAWDEIARGERRAIPAKIRVDEPPLPGEGQFP